MKKAVYNNYELFRGLVANAAVDSREQTAKQKSKLAAENTKLIQVQ